MDFKEKVEKTLDIKDCYKKGLTALGTAYKDLVSVTNKQARQLHGSVDIDKCTKAKYPNSNRWDYVFGYENTLYFIEPHQLKDSETKVVIKKFDWLQEWLKSSAPELNAIESKKYYWINASKRGQLLDTKYNRQLAQKGIKPISILKLE